MNALALVIGNANYQHTKVDLPNAINDANAISQKLSDLGFIVETALDCDLTEFMQRLSAFGDNLKKYDVGLFYFAGHGLEIDGVNCLTAVNTTFIDPTSARHTSVQLSLVIDQMERAAPDIKIIILDACRNNPLPNNFRGLNGAGLAPIYAPKGTLIAFSTSPGQTANEGGPGGNSIYTASLLNHLNTKDITIEEFFKRVRTSVYTLSGNKQTSWEHTSLIGTFSFNNSQIVHAVDLPYPADFIADKDFQSDGSNLGDIIISMKSHDFYQQGPALQRFKSISKSALQPAYMFLMGRNILQAAEGGEYRAKDFMGNLPYWVSDFTIDGENHLLNGLLFEMYFNSEGRLRRSRFKSSFLDPLYALETDKQYNASFKMIAEQLALFKHQIYYLPYQQTVAIEVKLDKIDFLDYQQKPSVKYKLASVKHENVELKPLESDSHYHHTELVSYDELKNRISQLLMIPSAKLTITCNYSSDEAKYIFIPYDLELERQIGI